MYIQTFTYVTLSFLPDEQNIITSMCLFYAVKILSLQND